MTSLRIRTRQGRNATRLAGWGLLVCLLAMGCAGSGESPRAVDGRVDLSDWDFRADGDVPLVGSWQICWNALLAPGAACPSGWQPVPVRGLWSEDTVGSPFGGRGVATYRLRIVLPPDSGPLAVVAGGPLTAHRLFIDGVRRGGLGVVGETPETTVAEVFNRVYELPPGSHEVELQVQVANFDFRGGGLRRLWYLGESDSIQAGVGLAILREGMLFAVGVVVGLGFLTLFALRPSERARGYFGMTALVLGLRAVPASISNFGELMAPWMSWGFTVRAEYLGMALAYFAFVGYARTKVPGIMPARTMDGLQGVALALAAIVAFAPMPIVLATLPMQIALPMILGALVLVYYGRAWTPGLPGVRITAVTSVLYAAVVVHDIVRSLQSGAGASVELFPYALILWILAESYQLLQELQQSFEQVESLSEELGDANFELQETEAAIVRFVPFDFLRTLGKHSIRDVNAGDHAASKMSVLHCGFHALGDGSDALPWKADFARINDLVAHLEPCIDHRNGFLNDYRGDGFQAFFPGGPRDAVAAGVEILAAARELDSQTAASGRSAEQARLRVGIGIDTGRVQLGTIGSGQHLVRGIVGEPVEGARRIEAAAVPAAGMRGRLLISAETREGLGEDCSFEVQTLHEPPGEQGGRATPLYEVLEERKVESRP